MCMFAVTVAEGAEVADLIAKLKDKDSDVRRAAAKELSELGPDAKSAVPDLSRTLKDRDLFVRRYSAEALGNIGSDAKSAIPGLSMLMNDERKEVQLAAVEALGKIGPDSITALVSAVKDPNKEPAVRGKAALSLGKIGKQARAAVPVFTDILSGKIKTGKATKKKGKGNDDDIRVEVATALGAVAKAEDKDAIAALRMVSEGKQKNKALQKAASDSLKELTGMPAKKKKK